MRQRIAFLRTLLADKPVLLLDEPFGALDAITRTELQEWLNAALATEPRTVLLVTHDVEEALLLCDRVLVLTDGRATADLKVNVAREGGSFAAVSKVRGEPSWPELFLFLAGSCIGFAAVNALSTRLFREESPDEPEVVISLATSLSLFSVCAAAATAAGISYVLSGWLVWPLASFPFTLVYVAAVGLEIGIAAHQHPAGGTGGESSRRGHGTRRRCRRST